MRSISSTTGSAARRVVNFSSGALGEEVYVTEAGRKKRNIARLSSGGILPNQRGILSSINYEKNGRVSKDQPVNVLSSGKFQEHYILAWDGLRERRGNSMPRKVRPRCMRWSWDGHRASISREEREEANVV